MGKVSDEVVEKLQTHISCSMRFFFGKSFHLLDNVEKYGRERKTMDKNIIRYMRHA